MRRRIHRWNGLSAFAAAAAVARASRGESTPANRRDDREANAPAGGRVVQSLFRFPASRLGPEFDELLRIWHDGWMRGDGAESSGRLPSITPEPSGRAHAFRSVSTDAATLFRRQCYGPGPRRTSRLNNLYRNFEERRKTISFRYMEDAVEEMRLMHAMTKRFYPAFLPPEVGSESDGTRRVHKKRARSTANTVHAGSTLPSDYDSPSKLSFQTVSGKDDVDNGTNRTQQWSWYPPAHFSSRGTPDNLPFRMELFKSMRERLEPSLRQASPDFKGFEHGRQSGMYWYPPGGVREWHSNYFDLVGNTKGGGSRKPDEGIFASQPWRMYFVRTVRDSDFDEKLSELKKSGREDRGNDDRSAMHIIPGDDPGITLDVLRRAGARPLTEEEGARRWSDEFAEDYSAPPGNDRVQANDTGVLDRNSVWRVPDRDGYVTLFRLPDLWHCIVSEGVHRYSLGFAFSDGEVRALLRWAGAEFDVADSRKNGAADVDDKDEL